MQCLLRTPGSISVFSDNQNGWSTDQTPGSSMDVSISIHADVEFPSNNQEDEKGALPPGIVTSIGCCLIVTPSSIVRIILAGCTRYDSGGLDTNFSEIFCSLLWMIFSNLISSTVVPSEFVTCQPDSEGSSISIAISPDRVSPQ